MSGIAVGSGATQRVRARLSSRWTALYKLAAPIFFLLALANVAWAYFDRLERFGEDAVVLLVLSPLLALFYFRAWRLADEVEDLGDALVFRHRGREQRIVITDVLNITWWQGLRDGATLWVRTPGPLGDRLGYLPKGLFNVMTGSNPEVDALILRIDRAKCGVVP